MKVLVTGCGRGGTNLGIEVVRTLGIPTTINVEDRSFFHRPNFPENYATKLATENNGFTSTALIEKLKEYDDLKVIFMIRHPYDNVLSKVLRGQPKSQGGDNDTESVTPDGTVAGASEALLYMHSILDEVISEFPDRVLVVKMEELTTEIKQTVDSIAAFIGVKPTIESYEYYKYNRNRYHQARYGNNLVRQVNLFLDLENNFDGFFKEDSEALEKIASKFSKIAERYGYAT